MSTRRFVAAATGVIRSKIFIGASVLVVAALVVGTALSHTGRTPVTKEIGRVSCRERV